MTELELSLARLQQDIEIPEVVLAIHPEIQKIIEKVKISNYNYSNSFSFLNSKKKKKKRKKEKNLP